MRMDKLLPVKVAYLVDYRLSANCKLCYTSLS